MRKFEAVIRTEELVLENKSNYVPTVWVKRYPTLRDTIPGGKYFIESGR